MQLRPIESGDRMINVCDERFAEGTAARVVSALWSVVGAYFRVDSVELEVASWPPMRVVALPTDWTPRPEGAVKPEGAYPFRWRTP